MPREMTRRFLLLSAFVVPLAMAVGAQAASDAAVADFVDRLNTAMATVSGGDAQAGCSRLVAQAFDIDAMAPLTSDGAWQRMSVAQKKAYRAGLSRRAARDCVSRSRDFGGQALQFVGVRTGDDGDRFIAVTAKGRTAIWRVRGAGRLRAVDVSVGGRSLVAAARQDARRVLQNSGGDLQALVDAID